MNKAEIYPGEAKPERLYFKSFLQMLRNSVGTQMFRNFYVRTPERGEFDALDDGSDACAFYVSAVLVIFGKIGGFHGTVASTIEDLRKSGWQEVEEPVAGDVLVWEKQKPGDKWQEHMGFSIGKGRAVSTSLTEKAIIEHDHNFGDANRKITQVLRMADWEQTGKPES
ncbi:hypothetical protein HYW36_02345 [Candidatus Saccharibacteria bacterium]|nr:hypothetical protein [Candidatus Saccharibacteria bacterium]